MTKTVTNNVHITPEEVKKIIIEKLEEQGLLPETARRFNFSISSTITREDTFYNVSWQETRPTNRSV